MGPSLKSTVRKRLWAITSALRLLDQMHAMTSLTFTNILKVFKKNAHTKMNTDTKLLLKGFGIFIHNIH